MVKKTFRFTQAAVDYFFGGRFSSFRQIADKQDTIIITDENLMEAHRKKFSNWRTIVVKAGEAYKTQSTADDVIQQLINMGADRKTLLVGLGGGVITDLTGYIASVYMRGIRFGFVPASLLAMVDAAIGGKNGIDVGLYKNMVGTIRQPAFIFYDLAFLQSLPQREWRNGFAEIIKHAAIKDRVMFQELASHEPDFYRKNKTALARLVQKNALIKTRVVQSDEFEQNQRRLLNFGHTLGHAIENRYGLSHGEAISIGMCYAARISEKLKGFKDTGRLKALLEKYQLPVEFTIDRDEVIGLLKMDKKKNKDQIHFVLLEKTGKAVVQPIAIEQICETLR